jgi:uncharacterized cupin superfamily protein
MSGRIAIERAATVTGSNYPARYAEQCRERARIRLGELAALTQFGVNLTRLSPGCWSSQRHWHTAEDEFVYVLEGELVLVTDAGEQTLRTGDCAGFPAGEANGHHLQNRSRRDAVVLEIGSRRPGQDEVHYPDIDLVAPRGRPGYTHRDGSPYDQE